MEVAPKEGREMDKANPPNVVGSSLSCAPQRTEAEASRVKGLRPRNRTPTGIHAGPKRPARTLRSPHGPALDTSPPDRGGGHAPRRSALNV
jgi:hypothetical protein